jgi:hypothetical protein
MMAEILCPTCGRPNSDEHSFCDYCGSPIKEPDSVSPDNSFLRDEFFAPEGSQNQEPGDEMARLDSLFSEQDSEEQSSQIQEPSQAEPEDDAFRLDEILPPENQKIQSEADEPDDPFELDNFISPQEPIQDPPQESDTLASKSKDDLFSPEKTDEVPPPDISSQPGTETPANGESSADPWLEHISQPDDQAPDITQPELPDSPDKLPEDLESLFSLLDPGQPAENNSQQVKKTEGEAETSEIRDEEEPTFESAGFEEDAGWLDMLQDPDSLDDSSPEVDPVLKDKKPQTDWLTKIKRLNKSTDLVEEDSSFPDWLTVSEKPAEEPPEIIEEELEETSSSDLPAWLQLDEDDEMLNKFLRKKDLTNAEFQPQITEDTQVNGISLDGYAVPEPEEDPSQSKKFPSWSEGGRGPEQIPDELQFLAGMDQEGVPSKIVDPFQGDDEYIDDLFGDELPEWLTTASTMEEILPFEEELSVGDLPGWVEAMRPVVESSDASGLSEDEEYIENYGPLAGIPSVLPAEADIVQDPDKVVRKPVDLIVNKAQQNYVNLLKRLIGEESKTKPIKKAAPIQSQRVLRWLIAIILLVTTAGTTIFGGNFNNPAPPERVSPLTGYGSLYSVNSILLQLELSIT